MKALKTHFEQVPVEIVKGLVEPEIVEKEKTAKIGMGEAETLKKEKR